MKIKKCKKIDVYSEREAARIHNYKNQIILERKVHLAIFALPKRKACCFSRTCGNDLVAQLVEHNTFNVRALGSSPSGITTLKSCKFICKAFFVFGTSCRISIWLFLRRNPFIGLYFYSAFKPSAFSPSA